MRRLECLVRRAPAFFTNAQAAASAIGPEAKGKEREKDRKKERIQCSSAAALRHVAILNALWTQSTLTLKRSHIGAARPVGWDTWSPPPGPLVLGAGPVTGSD